MFQSRKMGLNEEFDLRCDLVRAIHQRSVTRTSCDGAGEVMRLMLTSNNLNSK
jgi:hypothetical protein